MLVGERAIGLSLLPLFEQGAMATEVASAGMVAVLLIGFVISHVGKLFEHIVGVALCLPLERQGALFQKVIDHNLKLIKFEFIRAYKDTPKIPGLKVRLLGMHTMHSVDSTITRVHHERGCSP